MREELLIPIFLKKALAGEPLTVAGQGDQFRRFVYVRDLASAHVLAMSDRAAAADLQPRRTAEDHGARGRARHSRSSSASASASTSSPSAAGDFPGREVCADKAREELGWAATVDFDDGLRDTVGWFCAKWGHAARQRRRASSTPATATARGPIRPPDVPATGEGRRPVNGGAKAADA